MATIPELLEFPLEHHRAGRLQAAVEIYRQILYLEPNHFGAMHLLGVIAQQVGQPQLAIEYITRAIRLHENEAIFHNSLAEAYRAGPSSRGGSLVPAGPATQSGLCRGSL